MTELGSSVFNISGITSSNLSLASAFVITSLIVTMTFLLPSYNKEDPYGYIELI
jgi:hypothetical protein